jgi:hypothetical protein
MAEKVKSTKEKTILFQIDDSSIVVRFTRIGNKGIKKVEVKKGDETLMTAGIRLNLNWLINLRNQIGSKNLNEILQIAIQQIEPNIEQELVLAAQKNASLTKEINEGKKSSDEVLDLSAILEAVNSRIEKALMSPLDTKSQESIKQLKKHLEENKDIVLDNKTKITLNQMISVAEKIARLGDLSLYFNLDDSKDLFQDPIFRKTVLQIIDKINHNKNDEALRMLIGFVINSFRKNNLLLPETFFNRYIKPMVALNAGFVIERLSSSSQARSKLKIYLKQWTQ